MLQHRLGSNELDSGHEHAQSLSCSMICATAYMDVTAVQCLNSESMTGPQNDMHCHKDAADISERLNLQVFGAFMAGLCSGTHSCTVGTTVLSV